MNTLAFLLLIAVLLACVWLWVCAESTHIVRGCIRAAIGDDKKLLEDYKRVSFDKHLLHELFLDNPVLLYSQEIQVQLAFKELIER